METILTIKKMTRDECLRELERAQKDFDFYSSQEHKLTDFGKCIRKESGWLVLEMKENLKMMQDAGRDYVYIVNGNVWRYEVVDKILK